MKKQTHTVQELVHNRSFQQWVDGSAPGKAQIAFWDQWVQQSEHNRRIAIKAQEILVGVSFQFEAAPARNNEIADEWADLQKRLTSQAPPNADSRERYPKSLPERKNSMTNFFKVAAIIVFTFALSWYLATSSPFASAPPKTTIHTITTKAKEKKTIRLSDGSEIVLAAGSKLSYAEGWLAKPTKRVKLKGEAYFSIVPLKVKDHPKFIVQTTDGTAAVWGTQFSVSTYDNHTRVVLQTGEVRLHIQGKSSHTTTMMKPRQRADFKQNDQGVAIKYVNPQVYTSWASDRLVFDHTPLSVLVKRIRRTYGVKVVVAQKKLLTKKLSGSVDFGELDPFIHAVQQVLDVRITRRGDTVYVGNPSQFH